MATKKREPERLWITPDYMAALVARYGLAMSTELLDVKAHTLREKSDLLVALMADKFFADGVEGNMVDRASCDALAVGACEVVLGVVERVQASVEDVVRSQDAAIEQAANRAAVLAAQRVAYAQMPWRSPTVARGGFSDALLGGLIGGAAGALSKR